MTDEQKAQRRYALAISGGCCEVCGKPLIEGQMQAAHRIGNNDKERNKYGSMVIDSPLNVGYTCSLACNGALDISRDPVACVKLCQKIYSYEYIKLK